MLLSFLYREVIQIGEVIIQSYTPKDVLNLIGQEAGICYHSNVTDQEKNIKRAKNCIKGGHFRTMEYAQVYMVLKDYSAKLIREFYTAIGGMPTRLQESTRYINFKDGFDYWIPDAIKKDYELLDDYTDLMQQINFFYQEAIDKGVKPEDASSCLPLSMNTTVVVRTNARNLMDMSRQRLCTRAWKPYRELMRDIVSALSDYSEDWEWICDNTMMAKCDALGYCPETRGCGRYPKRDEVEIVDKTKFTTFDIKKYSSDETKNNSNTFDQMKDLLSVIYEGNNDKTYTDTLYGDYQWHLYPKDPEYVRVKKPETHTAEDQK